VVLAKARINRAWVLVCSFPLRRGPSTIVVLPPVDPHLGRVSQRKA
jgi:hypothetical protein